MHRVFGSHSSPVSARALALSREAGTDRYVRPPAVPEAWWPTYELWAGEYSRGIDGGGAGSSEGVPFPA